VKVLLISKEWHPKEQTGLGISSKLHLDILIKNGFLVKTVSKNPKNGTNFCLNFSNFLHFLIKFFSLRKKANKIIKEFEPDLIIIESLQTWISELFLTLKYKNNTKIILISHGISIFPYKLKIKYFIRFMIYLFYLPFLFFLLKKVELFYSLNWTNKCNRHLDEKLFKLINDKKKIIKYFNTSRFEGQSNNKINKKRIIISNFGYVGEIKNQKDFLKIAEEFKDTNIIFRVIFQSCDDNYLKSCKNFCKIKKLHNVEFMDGNNVDIHEKFNESYLTVNTSITEVFPLSIVESISIGVPFVSYDTGNTSSIKGGLIAKDFFELKRHVKFLCYNNFFYNKLKIQGVQYYQDNLNNLRLQNIFKNFNL
jgi:glycosyltransferase involved in cell wall biosynthesis